MLNEGSQSGLSACGAVGSAVAAEPDSQVKLGDAGVAAVGVGKFCQFPCC